MSRTQPIARGPFVLATLSPCAKCPYRVDAPRRLWAPWEFRRLLATDTSTCGVVYGCHKRNGHYCAGWLLDQRRRNVPSVALRAHLAERPHAHVAFDLVNDGGHRLFASVEAMCRANGVRPPKRLVDRYALLVQSVRASAGDDALVLLGHWESLRPWRRCAGAAMPLGLASGDVHAWGFSREGAAPHDGTCARCEALRAVGADGVIEVVS